MAARMPPTHDRAKMMQRPSTVPWPPILLVGAVGLGWALGEAIPVELFRGAPAARVAGVVLAAAALLLDAAAVLTLRRHATTVLPHRGSAALVTSGPYAYSRNPIYAGNVLLTIGLAFAFANAWLLATAAAEAALVRRLAIMPEERHLEARFGEAWRVYRARTSRWLGVAPSSRR